MQKQKKANVALTEKEIFSVLEILCAAIDSGDWSDESAQKIVIQVEQGLNHRETIFDR
tara:strand:- start:306 stop:479 length:174 start_codon:yes stop_codon:yes gene_type:complete